MKTRVCAWCSHEVIDGNERGQKYEPGCIPPGASHACCKICKPGVDVQIAAELKEQRLKAVRVSQRLERAAKVHLILAAADLEG